MKAGYGFNNGGMHLTVIKFCNAGNRNVGLFRRESDGMYITARNTSKGRDGTYSWAWGHYFMSYETACEDYKTRLQEMLSYKS